MSGGSRLVITSSLMTTSLMPSSTGHVVHDVEHGVLEDGAQAAGAGVAAERLLRDAGERALRELELDAVHLEELLELLHEAVLRLGEDVDQRLLVELVQRREHRQAADELGDEAELEQVFRLHRARAARRA